MVSLFDLATLMVHVVILRDTQSQLQSRTGHRGFVTVIVIVAVTVNITFGVNVTPLSLLVERRGALNVVVKNEKWVGWRRPSLTSQCLLLRMLDFYVQLF